MLPDRLSRFVPALLLLLAACALLALHARTRPPAPLVLWAWERPEDLSFIDPAHVEVAYLAATVKLTPAGFQIQPRRQPLTLPAHTRTIAVFRIESLPDSVSLPATYPLAMQIANLAPGLDTQIDFDARLSERLWYRDFLFDLRRTLPPHSTLSITALASWCIEGSWLSTLPVDEAVPMLFRMGITRPADARIAAWSALDAPTCSTSIGIATDEPHPPLDLARRTYLFSRSRWTSATVAQYEKELHP